MRRSTTQDLSNVMWYFDDFVVTSQSFHFLLNFLMGFNSVKNDHISRVGKLVELKLSGVRDASTHPPPPCPSTGFGFGSDIGSTKFRCRDIGVSVAVTSTKTEFQRLLFRLEGASRSESVLRTGWDWRPHCSSFLQWLQFQG